jgi:hypothetical protein
MRGLKTFRAAVTIATGHALVQNIRRDRYDLASPAHPAHRLRAAFGELAHVPDGDVNQPEPISSAPVLPNATVPF